MHQVAVVGSGISGLSVARLLKEKGYNVIVFEKSDVSGGLVKCTVEDGVLFHRVGGHVFNSKNPQVLDWFFSFFNKEEEFLMAKRNSQVWMEQQMIGYPIENNIYQLDISIINKIISELLESSSGKVSPKDNFETFLKNNFGKTLYDIYFKPYNSKIWNADLTKIPLPWLEGKLPMPNLQEIFLSNITRSSEKDMVHSFFYYPKQGGSSFLINRLKSGLDIKYNVDVKGIIKESGGKWIISDHAFDSVIYTGDVRDIQNVIYSEQLSSIIDFEHIRSLKSNGTSNVLCEVDPFDLSWLYIPEVQYKAHRIIFTGNFSPLNNGNRKMTCTVEFSDYVSPRDITSEITQLPGHLKPIAFNYEPNSYVIQGFETRDHIQNLKNILEVDNFYLLGRFAEWEYYNMDKAIEAAMLLVDRKF